MRVFRGKGLLGLSPGQEENTELGKLYLHPVVGEKEQGAEEEERAKEEWRSGKEKTGLGEGSGPRVTVMGLKGRRIADQSRHTCKALHRCRHRKPSCSAASGLRKPSASKSLLALSVLTRTVHPSPPSCPLPLAPQCSRKCPSSLTLCLTLPAPRRLQT